MAVFEQGHALIVGAGGDLPNTVEDANGLAGVLRDPARCAYPPEQVHLLAGAQAGVEALRQALQALARPELQGATAVVFFSGHGRLEQRPGKPPRFFLLPHGYDLQRLDKTALSGAEFTELLAAIPAQRLLVLLDCCHAGEIAGPGPGWLAKEPGAALPPAPLPPEALEMFGRGGGRVLIASSKEDELSFGGWPYSAFTQAVLEALCGQGAARQDGLVRVADLALFARQRVLGLSANRQTPVLHFEQADNFAVAYYAAGDPQPKGLPFAQAAVIEPEPGAWRGPVQYFNSGGGPLILGGVGKYVQGDEIHYEYYEDRSVTFHGTASGNTVVTGNGNQLDSTGGVSLADLLALLGQLQRGLDQAPLPPQEQQELQGDLAAAQGQAAQLAVQVGLPPESQPAAPPPGRALLFKRLAGVVEFLADSATIAASAPQLLEQARRALEWARLLFGG